MIKALCVIGITISFSLSYSDACAQEFEKYLGSLKDIVHEAPSQIHNKVWCDEAVDDLDKLSENLEAIIDDPGALNGNDLKVLRSAKTLSEALESFIRAVGNSSYMKGYLKEAELSLVNEVIDFSISEVFANKFCCKIYIIKFEEYACLLAYKPGGKEIYNIKAEVKSGSTITTMTMGLSANEYRQFWSNKDMLGNMSFSIQSVVCKLTGTSVF